MSAIGGTSLPARPSAAARGPGSGAFHAGPRWLACSSCFLHAALEASTRGHLDRGAGRDLDRLARARVAARARGALSLWNEMKPGIAILSPLATCVSMFSVLPLMTSSTVDFAIPVRSAMPSINSALFMLAPPQVFGFAGEPTRQNPKTLGFPGLFCVPAGRGGGSAALRRRRVCRHRAGARSLHRPPRSPSRHAHSSPFSSTITGALGGKRTISVSQPGKAAVTDDRQVAMGADRQPHA